MVGTTKGGVQMWNGKTKVRIATFNEHQASVVALSATPNGDSVFYYSLFIIITIIIPFSGHFLIVMIIVTSNYYVIMINRCLPQEKTPRFACSNNRRETSGCTPIINAATPTRSLLSWFSKTVSFLVFIIIHY